MIHRRVVLSGWKPSRQSSTVDLEAVHDGLLDLINGDPDQCVLEGNDRVTAVLPGRKRNGGLELQLLGLRDENGRSIQFRPGSPLADLRLLEGHKTGEVTHVCMWPDGIAAQDWFADVPRLSRLSEFLRVKLQTHVQFSPIFDQSLWDALQDVTGQLRYVRVSLHQDTVPDDAEDLGVFATYRRQMDPRVPVMDMGLKMGRRSPRDAYLPDSIDADIQRAADVAPEMLENLVVRGRSRSTGRMRTINVYKNRIEQEVEIAPSTEDSGRPDPGAAYRAITDVVNGMRNDGRLDEHVRANVQETTSS